MEDLAYYNGKITRLSEMMVPFNDRSHFFGDGVYDASVARNGIIFKLEDHLDRFFNSMALIDIQPDFTKDELRELLQALCQKLDTGDLFVYFQVSRGTAIRNHSYAQTLKPNLSVYMLPWTGDFSSQKRLKLMTTPDHRFALSSLTAYINDPERKYDEWLQWPEHRRRIEDYEATLPDAPRSRAKCATPVVTPSGDTVSYVPTAAFPEI